MDLVNGLFELCGGLIIWLNVLQIRKDKCLKGARHEVALFFTVWGFWNLFYYPSLDQTFSFICGIVIFTANLIYWVHVIYYENNYFRK